MPLETPNPDLKKALDKLSRYLAMRDHSLFELRQKLRRAFNDDVVEHALAHAAQVGLIASDEEIAARVTDMYARQNKSRRYIEEHLTQRGLPVPLIDEESEKEKARQLLIRRFQELRTLNPEERGEAFQYLERRGFEEPLIEQVLNEKR